MSETPAAGAPKLGWVTKALYGVGSLSTATKAQLLGLVLFYYSNLLGMPPTTVSFAIFVALLIDAFWDPVVGQISDSTHTRLGRRHPFIYAGIVPAAICFTLLFMPPRGIDDDGLFLWLLVLIVATRMFDSVIEIPGAALMPELSRNYDERTSLGSWRYVFLSVVGRALATILAFGIFLKGTKAQPFGQMNAAGYAPFAITVAIISSVAILIAALATQRFVPFMHRPQKQASIRASLGAMAVALRNRNFLSLALSAFIFGIAVGITGGLQIYFVTYFWELNSDALRALGLWTIPGGAVGVVVAPYWARLMGKKRACLIVFFMAILSTTVPIGLRLLNVMPPNSSPWVLRILIIDSIATGLLATMGFIIVTAMLADVVEEIQAKSGRRSEGLLFAADSLVRKITTSFTALLPGIVLAFVHFPTGAKPGHVPAGVLTELAQIYLPVVTVLYLCSTSSIMFYKIDRRRHEDNLERIAQAATLAEETDQELNPHLAPDVVPRPARSAAGQAPA